MYELSHLQLGALSYNTDKANLYDQMIIESLTLSASNNNINDNKNKENSKENNMLRAQSHQSHESERSQIMNLSLANQDIEDKLSILFDVKNLGRLAKVDNKRVAWRFEITLVNIFNDFYDKL